MSFWGEPERLNVPKAGAAYVIAAWLIVQWISLLFPTPYLPDRDEPPVACFLMLSSPPARIQVLPYEVTPGRFKPKEEVDNELETGMFK